MEHTITDTSIQKNANGRPNDLEMEDRERRSTERLIGDEFFGIPFKNGYDGLG